MKLVQNVLFSIILLLSLKITQSFGTGNFSKYRNDSMKLLELDLRDLIFCTSDHWDIRRPFIFSYLNIRLKSLFADSGKLCSNRRIGLKNIDPGHTIFQYFHRNPMDSDGIYLLIYENDVKSVFQQISEHELLGPIFKWIIICIGCNDQSTNQLDFDGFATLISAMWIQERYRWQFHMWEIHSHKSNNFFHKKFLGFWDNTEKFSEGSIRPKFGLTGDLHGVPLNVRLLTTHFDLGLSDDNDDLIYHRKVLNLLQSELNFTVRESVKPKAEFGGFLKNGTFDGVIGDFIREEMDIMAHDITLTSDRQRVCDFSSPVRYTQVGILFKKPNRFPESSIMIYTSPFSVNVWVAIIVSCILFALSLSFVEWIGDWKNPKCRSVVYESPRIGGAKKKFWTEKVDACFNIVAIICGQGSSEFLKKTSSSVLITSFGLLAVIVATSYTAVLNSYFTMMTSPLIVKDIDSLVFNPDYKLGMSITFLDNFKGHPRFGQINTMLRADKRNTIVPGKLNSAIERIFLEKFVLIETSHVINQIPKEKLCQVQFVRLVNSKMYTRHWPFKKNSPYVHIISKRINKMKISGVLSYLEDKSCQTERNLRNCPEEEMGQPAFKLDQVYALFAIIAIGIILAIIYLLYEKINKHKCT